MNASEAKKLSVAANKQKEERSKKMSVYYESIKKACDRGELFCQIRKEIPPEDKKELNELGYTIKKVTAHGRGAYGEDEYDTYINWN